MSTMRVRPVRVLVALLLGAAVGADNGAAQQPLMLREAVALAQGQGLQAEAARASRDAARFRDGAFKGSLLPQLSVGGTLPNYNRSIISVLQPDGSAGFRPQNQTDAALTATLSQRLPTGGDLFVSSSLATLQVSGQQSFRTYSTTPVTIGVRQQLFRPNLLALDRREQPVRLDISERQFLEAREDVALQTTALYFDVHAARLSVANATANVAVNDTLFRLNSGRFEVGKIGENDLLQSELALLRARNALDASVLAVERAEAALRLGIRLPAGAPLALDVSQPVPDFPVDTAVAVREAMRNRASVAGAELQQIQAQRRVTEAKLNNGIGATLDASYGFNATASQFNQAYTNLLEAQRFRLGVEVPIVRWGAGRSTVQAAEADRDQAAATAKQTLEQTALEARFAVRELILARRQLQIAAKADTVAAKRFEVAYNRYVVGRITVDNLYLAQSEKDGAVAAYAQALRGHWLALYRVRRLTLFDFEVGAGIR